LKKLVEEQTMSEKETSKNQSSESQFEKCPKCGGEMNYGSISPSGGFRILKHGDLQGDKVYAFYCRDCGFIELYKERSTKEPWRWPKKQQAPSTKKPQKPEKEQPYPETRKRLVR